MLRLKLQYFGHLMWSADSVEKTDAGRDWRQKEKGTTENEMVRYPITDSTNKEIVEDKEAWHAAVYWATKSQTWFSESTIFPPW